MTPSRHILSFAQYASIRHATPYVVDVGRGGARLVLFGSWHSSNPADPMFDQIEQAFTDLAPLFALHEGTPPQVEPDREVAIRRHGEAGLLRHLGARAGIETDSMDVALEDEARRLRAEIGAEAALVFLVVRQCASFNRKTARMDFEGYFGDFFARIAPGLGLEAIDWPLVEREHRRVLGTDIVPRRISGVDTDPMRNQLLTQRIARRSNRLRDEHMLDRLLAAAASHARVFATVGVTHAVMLEPALRAGLNPQS